MLTVDVTNLQSTGKFPSREDFLDAIEDGILAGEMVFWNLW